LIDFGACKTYASKRVCFYFTGQYWPIRTPALDEDEKYSFMRDLKFLDRL